MATGRAPDTARSLTVPLTASSPIEPPGKRIGVTTKASVVIATHRPPTSTQRGVAEGARAPSLANAGTNTPSTSFRLALPPAPWAIVTRSSVNRCGRPPPPLDARLDLGPAVGHRRCSAVTP